MSNSIICDRAFQFACRIVPLCERMSKRGFGAYHISKQLIRCGTSIGANAEEAQEGQTKADYIAKMSISCKESRESRWWLRLAVATGATKAEDIKWELDESNALRFMIRSAIRTARSSPDRGHSTV
jgi:four helix bundle protein